VFWTCSLISFLAVSKSRIFVNFCHFFLKKPGVKVALFASNSLFQNKKCDFYSPNLLKTTFLAKTVSKKQLLKKSVPFTPEMPFYEK
jgi:hypothetical protein